MNTFNKIRKICSIPFNVIAGICLFISYLLTADDIEQTFGEWFKKHVNM
jgi:hypothetical protein